MVVAEVEVEVAVIDCEFSWIFWSHCALCLFHYSVRLPCPRCCPPAAELVPLPFSWRMTCGVMAEDLTPGCVGEQLLQAQSSASPLSHLLLLLKAA